jgi:hypothetical protein
MTENLEFSSHNYSAIPKAENRTRKHWKAYLATTKHPPHIFFPGNAVKLVVKGFWFYGGIKNYPHSITWPPDQTINLDTHS